LSPGGTLRELCTIPSSQKGRAVHHKELNVLSAIFNFYLQEASITYNPVLAVKKPQLRIIRPHYTPTATLSFAKTS
jgi:hypothetical protein